MISYKNIFLDWYKNDFVGTDLVARMADTVEDSPWHREENVWVHTQMVVDQYLSRCPDVWSKKDFMGAVMCAFHDTGKPRAEETIERGDGSTYRAYKRHETFSGAIFQNYLLSQESDHPIRSVLDVEDIYNIQVMLTHHLPYKYNKENTQVLKYHMDHFGLTDVFVRCVNSDAYGRITDDGEKTRNQSDAWGDRFKNTVGKSNDVGEHEKTVVLLCGPSGSGKSTVLSNTTMDHAVHSMDLVRLNSYGTDNYQLAFERSNDDRDFSAKVTQDFVDKIKNHELVFVDNTNLTRKRRNMYSKSNGRYKTEAIVFINTMSVLRHRCDKRTEVDQTKVIPKSVLDNQYHSMQPPLVGEVGNVTVLYNGDQ